MSVSFGKITTDGEHHVLHSGVHLHVNYAYLYNIGTHLGRGFFSGIIERGVLRGAPGRLSGAPHLLKELPVLSGAEILLLQQGEVVGSIDIHSDKGVGDGDDLRLIFMAAQKPAHAVSALVGENRLTQLLADEWWMTALPAELRVPDSCCSLPVLAGSEQLKNACRLYKRYVDGKEKKETAAPPELFHTRLDRGKHAVLVVAVHHPARRCRLGDGNKLRRSEADDGDYFLDSTVSKESNDSFEQRLLADPKKRLEALHAG